MKERISAIKLVNSTNRYNTYQFYGEMANRNIDVKDGLKIAALTCLSWVRDRIGDGFPKETDMPSQNDYKKAKNSDFKSFSINESYSIIVESNIDEGIWSLRVIENDTGAIENERVEGRSIQSDIAFRIVEDRLECGFKTTINDQDINAPKAKCVRFSVVKELALNPNFGLKQISNIYDPLNMIIDVRRIEELKRIINSIDNQLPLIIYTYDDHSIEDMEKIKSSPYPSFNESYAILEKAISKKEEVKEDSVLTSAPAYAYRYLGHARTYLLPKSLFKAFDKEFSIKVKLNQVVVIDLNKKVKIYDYEDKNKYKNFIFNYQRNREYNFNEVLFLEKARLMNEEISKKEIENRDKELDEISERINQLKSQRLRIERKDQYVQVEDNREELIKTLEKLEKNNNEIELLKIENNKIKKELNERNTYIAYIHRLEDMPKNHKDIAKWAEKYENIILEKKAIDCLNNNDAQSVSIDVICNALDFLNQVYWRYLFEGITEDEVNEESRRIYNRPYNVSPSGIPTSAKSDCKIRYAFNNEKRREHVLDQHLKIGAHGELLRIYFIIDKDKKKIVIGSLPNHLEY